MYAHLEEAVPKPNKETADKVLHHLQCAHRFTTQGNKWTQEKNCCLFVSRLSLELAEGMLLNIHFILNKLYSILYLYVFDFAAYISCSNKTENHDQKKRFLSSAKIMLVSVVSQIEVC